MNDTMQKIIHDAHDLAKAAIAPDLVQPCVVETIARRLERLVKNGFYVTPDAAARKFAEEQSKKDAGLSFEDAPGQHVMLRISGDCCYHSKEYSEYVVVKLEPCDRFGGGRETLKKEGK